MHGLDNSKPLQLMYLLIVLLLCNLKLQSVITQIQQVARDDINVDNRPALAIILGDIKNSLTWSLDMIRRALVAEDVGLYYAVRLIQRDFLKPGIDIGPDVYTPLSRRQSGAIVKKRSCDVIFFDRLPPESVKRIQAGELTIVLGMPQHIA